MFGFQCYFDIVVGVWYECFISLDKNIAMV